MSRSPKVRVYVVEDDPAVGAFVRQVLLSAGYEVQLFEAAATAEAALGAGPAPDEMAEVLLLDMYGRTGDSVASEEFLQGVSRKRPRCAAIVVSGRLSSNDFFRLVLQGAAGFLAKPFSADELVRTVRVHADELARSASASGTPSWGDLAGPKVFLCACPEDGTWAAGLGRLLAREGVTVCQPPPGALGEDVRARTEAQFDASHACLLVFGRRSLQCERLLQHMGRIIERKRREGDAFLAVLLLRGARKEEIPPEYRTLELWDCSDPAQIVDRFLSLATRVRGFLGLPLR